MKMVKSLLLGSAAGLVAVAGAQAADLPVKAKPVQGVAPNTERCVSVINVRFGSKAQCKIACPLYPQ